MQLNRRSVRQLLKSFQFKNLFIEELGWDVVKQFEISLVVDGDSFTMTAISQKRGIVVYQCTPESGHLPDHALRRKIDREITKYTREHLVVYTDDTEQIQIWQWVRREPGKPQASREVHYNISQDGETLIQKLDAIAVSLEEEEKIVLADMKHRTRKAFDVDKVTKKFFDRFTKEHTAFRDFVEGIASELDRDWYVSLMLNRLMFIYFMQKKGFLDNDQDYLRNRLTECQRSHGEDTFCSFYRYFLVRLFHDGLGSQVRTEELENLLGQIPYLNGGLFEVHHIEQTYENIQIPDVAFEKVFDFFDQYHWHLDDRPLRNDNEINPDVLGYIFEKYINQKQMGAYYTKEDITEYISKNCIIPYFFEASKQAHPDALDSKSPVWQLLADDPNRYIYLDVQKGVDLTLPDMIASGVDDVAKRTHWNELADADYALPTEIWREYVARRQRCMDIREKLTQREVTNINDLITYNLDIRQFAQDVIAVCDEPRLIEVFYQALSTMSVLDPTCGSGAFLFAALNILEPLYDGCLERMQSFLADGQAGEHQATFEQILQEVNRHPNRRYFIFKSIMINNLYGVDIMEEATEICKLRLFLKLVAQVEPDDNEDNFGIEPLPDIDFNIRAGNTLVGFTSLEEVRNAIKKESDSGQMKLVFDEKVEQQIITQAKEIDQSFREFRELQTDNSVDGGAIAQKKNELRQQLSLLRDKLDQYLAEEYESGQSKKDKKFKEWKESHQPFHWFVEFYGIINYGGFDVIIGNPPYIEYKNIKNYRIVGFQTLNCCDLYAYVVEQSYKLLVSNGYVGLIIPISIFGTNRFQSLKALSLKELESSWVSHFANRPSQLFDGAQKRLTILLGLHKKTEKIRFFATSYLRWVQNERKSLFLNRIQYVHKDNSFQVFHTSLGKLGTSIEVSAFNTLVTKRETLTKAIKNSKASQNFIYYTRKFGYFLAFLDFIPEIEEIKTGKLRLPSELKTLEFGSSESVIIVIAALTSSTFFWFWNVLSDCRNLNRRDILAFPFNPESLSECFRKLLLELGKSYLSSLRSNSKKMIKNGLYIQTFDYSACKPIINEIDYVLAQHYNFTDEELDFIINYDIKYRMGLGK